VFRGDGCLSSVYAVTDLASAAIACASLAIAELLNIGAGTHALQPGLVRVSRRLASFWFGMSIRPSGWELPPPWDPIAGDYKTRDGWIRLHTNAPRHREAAERVLGYPSSREAVARTVARWTAYDLESSIIRANGCAAQMHTVAEWAEHPQGQAIASEPLVHQQDTDSAAPSTWAVSPTRPLEGIRVLDLTRILAGPVASRFLAGYGATVLRIDPPHWEEPALAPEVTLGKQCARLDLTKTSDRERFEQLLSETDILLHSYRPGALEHLNLGSAIRRSLAPGLVDVCLDAYGWTGPWAARRGFDSLVQMSCGIADTGMRVTSATKPTPLPVQALDHATGYLMAAAAIRAWTRRLTQDTGTEARLSLARTAKLLLDAGEQTVAALLAPETSEDLSPIIEPTRWGPARRLQPPAHITGAPMRWDLPASKLGSSRPSWT